jgi:hypothetical protein
VRMRAGNGAWQHASSTHSTMLCDVPPEHPTPPAAQRTHLYVTDSLCSTTSMPLLLSKNTPCAKPSAHARQPSSGESGGCLESRKAAEGSSSYAKARAAGAGALPHLCSLASGTGASRTGWRWAQTRECPCCRA